MQTEIWRILATNTTRIPQLQKYHWCYMDVPLDDRKSNWRKYNYLHHRYWYVVSFWYHRQREVADNIGRYIIDEDEQRISRVLLTDTTINVRVKGAETTPFVSNVRSPQGDGISGPYFNVYFENAKRKQRAALPLYFYFLDCFRYGIPIWFWKNPIY